MLDSLDEQLVQLLQSDARQSSEVLAKQLHVSSTTIRRRLRKLIQSGVIRIVAAVDPSKVGLPLVAVIAYNVSYDKIDSVLHVLASQSEVKWLSTTAGRFDIVATTQFPSTDALFNFMQRVMSKAEGVKGSEMFICLHVEKGRYMRI